MKGVRKMEPMGYLASTQIYGLGQEARSALPTAPVVTAPEREPAAARPRAFAAAALRRLADAVAPPARTPLCVDGH